MNQDNKVVTKQKKNVTTLHSVFLLFFVFDFLYSSCVCICVASEINVWIFLTKMLRVCVCDLTNFMANYVVYVPTLCVFFSLLDEIHLLIYEYQCFFFDGNPCLLAIYMLWTRKKTEKKLTPQLLDTWNRNSCLFSCFNILLASFISISNLDDDDDDDKLSGSEFFFNLVLLFISGQLFGFFSRNVNTHTHTLLLTCFGSIERFTFFVIVCHVEFSSSSSSSSQKNFLFTHIHTHLLTANYDFMSMRVFQV